MKAKEGSGNFIIGFLVGAVSTLPGISGATFAVLMGIYERLIDDLSNLRTKIKEDLGFILTVGSGIAVGLISFVYVADYLIDTYFVATMFLFAGLIIGQIPDLVKITKQDEPVRRSHIVWMAIGFIMMMIMLLLHSSEGGSGYIDNSGIVAAMLLSFAAGAVFAISKIIPGISGYTVLIALGLYVWMLTIIKEMQLIYLIPFAIGFVVSLFVFAKVMKHILGKYHHPVYYFITGLTVGSVVLIIMITDIAGWADIFVGCGALIAGTVISLLLGMLKRSATEIK